MFEIFIDYPQKRIKRDRLATSVDGTSWGKSFFENVIVEPITKACMLAPLPLTSAWNTNASGAYSRLKKNDYILTSSNWENVEHGRVAGDIYLYSRDINELIKTNFNFRKNQGVYLSWHAYNVGNDDFIQLECGWGDVDFNDYDDSSVSLRFYAGGECEVFRNGVLSGRYSITGDIIEGTEWQPFGQQTSSNTVDVVLIPKFRRRTLLCITNRGGGFVHTFLDVPESETDAEITREEPFWWYVPQGQAKVQCAPLRYAEEGYITAVRTKFLFPPPPAGSEGDNLQVRAFFDSPGEGYIVPDPNVFTDLVEANNPNLQFVPDGVKKEARIKVEMIGDGFSTPFLYGAECVYPAEIVNMPDETESVYQSVKEFSLSVPNNPSDVSLDIKFFKTEDTETVRLHELSNRAVGLYRILSGSVPVNIQIIDGRNAPPEYDYGLDDLEFVSTFNLKVRDAWALLDRYILDDQYVMDGLTLKQAILGLLNIVGIEESETVISDVDFNLPRTGTDSDGKFLVVGNVGDSIAKIIEQLHQDYAGNFYYGFKPTVDGIKFYFVSPDDFPTTPIKTMYLKTEDAKTAIGGDYENNFYDWIKSTIRRLRFSDKSAEANMIWLTGYDHYAKKPLLARLVNEDSLNPELSVMDRPKNWMGEPVKYAYANYQLTNIDALKRGGSILCKRLFPAQTMVEFECFPIFDDEGIPVWVNDVIEIDTIGKVRIESLTWEAKRDIESDMHLEAWKNITATYTGVLIDEN